jgi:cell division protein FtsQ
VLVIALTCVLVTGARGERLGQGLAASVDNGLARLGFKLQALHVQGASPMAERDIRAVVGLYADQPILGLDLDQIRQRIEKVGWVKQATVVRLLPDTVVVAVVERKHMAVWQHDGKSVVLDDKGQVIPEADAARFPTLPLVVGPGADEHAAEILQAVAQRARLMGRLEALVRVDDRRWDLRLKDGSLVQLPAVGEDEALIQLEQLDERTRILELGFERIDLRDPDVVAVRPRNGSAPGQLVAGGA